MRIDKSYWESVGVFASNDVRGREKFARKLADWRREAFSPERKIRRQRRTGGFDLRGDLRRQDLEVKAA